MDNDDVLRRIKAHDTFSEDLAQPVELIAGIVPRGDGIAVAAIRGKLLYQTKLADIARERRLCAFHAALAQRFDQLVLGLNVLLLNQRKDLFLSL